MLMLYFSLGTEPEPFNNPDVQPTNKAPIIHNLDGQRVADLARWRLIPTWSNEDEIAQHTFSRKSEGTSPPSNHGQRKFPG